MDAGREIREIRLELEKVQRQLEHLEALGEGLFYVLVGTEKRNAWFVRWDDQKQHREFDRKWRTETPVHKLGIPYKQVLALERALCEDAYYALVTLEDLARMSRQDVARIPGVGPVTLDRLEAAFADRGVSWAEAS